MARREPFSQSAAFPAYPCDLKPVSCMRTFELIDMGWNINVTCEVSASHT